MSGSDVQSFTSSQCPAQGKEFTVSLQRHASVFGDDRHHHACRIAYVSSHQVGDLGGVGAQLEEAGLADDVPQDDVGVLRAARQRAPAPAVAHRRHRPPVPRQRHLPARVEN